MTNKPEIKSSHLLSKKLPNLIKNIKEKIEMPL